MIDDTKNKPFGVPKLWEGNGFPIVFMPALVIVCLILVLIDSLI
ncbi:hypothetical protein [Advenella sp. S44]|nr:hypothetical protein [Advenella sp. S44]